MLWFRQSNVLSIPVRRAGWLLAALVIFNACQPTGLSEGPPEVRQNRPGWLPATFSVDTRSATEPDFREDEVIFTVKRGDCSNRPDSSGPSDCARKTTRSTFSTGTTWRLDQKYLYSFEFWIDPSLTYRAYRNPQATKTGGVSSTLSIARWQGRDDLNNQLFDLKVDAMRGVTFMGRTCIRPSDFGGWHKFDMRIKWADDDTGFLEVRCNRRPIHEGLPIFAISDVPTNQALHCFRANNCDPERNNHPDRFEMELGIIHDAERVGGRAVLPRIGPQGLTVKMRRIIERRLYVIFGRVDAL